MATGSKVPTKRVLTPIGMMSHPHVITPRPYEENGVKKGEPRYQLMLVFPMADAAKFRAENADGQLVEVDIKKLAVQLAREHWVAGTPADKGGDMTSNEAFKAAFLKGDGTPAKGWPFIDGDTIAAQMEAKKKAGFERFKGMLCINTKSYESVKPMLSYYDVSEKKTKPLHRSSDVDMKRAGDLFVGGNYAGAELSMRPSFVSGTHFISFYLNAVRFIREGEKFGGKGMMDRFDGVYGGESPHDPTKGMDDEIPF